eukprot:GFKZ01003251.1.p1 GENE.GFKZ01003251.1~~GFKZ01003251.1.p1  ORF type:complete len:500 (+),score=51.47 GFKZ01003251.1:82-1500(+)
MSIRNNLIAYGAPALPWYAQEVNITVINALIIAILATLFSYQASALLTDVAFGFKRRGTSRASDLHIALLTRRSSPLAILNSALRWDWLTRKYYHGDIPPSTLIIREEQKIRIRVLVKLAFLLVVAPVTNTAAVFLTGEAEKILSFKEADFEGVGFGVNKDLSIVAGSRISELCLRSDIDLKPSDVNLAQFSVCRNPPGLVIHSQPRGLVSFSILRNSSIDLKVQIGVVEVWSGNTATLFANDTVFVVKPILSRDDLEDLVNMGIARVSSVCASSSDSDGTLRYTSENGGAKITESGARQAALDEIREIVHERSIDCEPTGNPTEAAFQILRELDSFLTFVRADSLLLATVNNDVSSEPNYMRRDSLPFLRRRQRILGVPLLATLTGALLLLRVVTVTLLNNDIGIGIEGMVRNYFGFNWWESMLAKDGRRVWYGKKYQDGTLAHYGLKRNDMQEVEKFDGGVIGIDFARGF